MLRVSSIGSASGPLVRNITLSSSSTIRPLRYSLRSVHSTTKALLKLATATEFKPIGKSLLIATNGQGQAVLGFAEHDSVLNGKKISVSADGAEFEQGNFSKVNYLPQKWVIHFHHDYQHSAASIAEGQVSENNKLGIARKLRRFPDRDVAMETDFEHLDDPSIPRLQLLKPNEKTENTMIFGTGIGWNIEGYSFLQEPSSQYMGEVIAGQPHGNGVLQSQRELYIGQWQNGERTGFGFRFDYQNEHTYEGVWKRDLPHGLGESRTTDGRTYTGHFRDGQYDGEGVYRTIDTHWSGKWTRNTMTEPGEIKAIDNSFQYLGEWKSETAEDVSFGVFRMNGKVCWEGSVKHVIKGQSIVTHGVGRETSEKSGEVVCGMFVEGKVFQKLEENDKLVQEAIERGRLAAEIASQNSESAKLFSERFEKGTYHAIDHEVAERMKPIGKLNEIFDRRSRSLFQESLSDWYQKTKPIYDRLLSVTQSMDEIPGKLSESTPQEWVQFYCSDQCDPQWPLSQKNSLRSEYSYEFSQDEKDPVFSPHEAKLISLAIAENLASLSFEEKVSAHSLAFCQSGEVKHVNALIQLSKSGNARLSDDVIVRCLLHLAYHHSDRVLPILEKSIENHYDRFLEAIYFIAKVAQTISPSTLKQKLQRTKSL